MSNKNNAINFLAKAITGYCFRNGIVEDYHADGCLNDEQMKALNKYMVNRIGFLLQLYVDGRKDDIEKVIGWHGKMCEHWDDIDITEPAAELKDIKEIMKRMDMRDSDPR